MIRTFALAAAVALVTIPAASGARSADYASAAWNILPPGQSGDLLFPPTASDQLKLYDGLTPKGGNVGAADLARYFKPERFGVSIAWVTTALASASFVTAGTSPMSTDERAPTSSSEPATPRRKTASS